MNKRHSMKFWESYLESFEDLWEVDHQLAHDYIIALVEYSLNDKPIEILEQETSDVSIKWLKSTLKKDIKMADKAKLNYDKLVSRGKTGGRPKKEEPKETIWVDMETYNNKELITNNKELIINNKELTTNNKKQIDNNKQDLFDYVERNFNSNSLINSLKQYIEQRLNNDNTFDIKRLEVSIKNLKLISDNETQQEIIVNQSVANNWSNFYNTTAKPGRRKPNYD